MGAHIIKGNGQAYCGKTLTISDKAVQLQTYQNSKMGEQRFCSACKDAVNGKKTKKGNKK